MLKGFDGRPLRLKEGDRFMVGRDGSRYVRRADGTVEGPDG